LGETVGVDIGTSKPRVAVVEGGVPHVIAVEGEARTASSVVGFAPDGQVLVGEAAASLARSRAENVVSAAARLVARRFDSDR
jgi:molecular chaperone DnaK (HSP70)